MNYNEDYSDYSDDRIILIHYPDGTLRRYPKHWFSWQIGKKYYSGYIKQDIIVAEILSDKSEVWFDKA